MTERDHTFHIKTNISASTIIGGILVGLFSGYIGFKAYRKLDSQIKPLEARVKFLETERLSLHKRDWILGLVESRLYNQKSQTKYEVASAIYSLSISKKIPVEIILGIIDVESNWDLRATNGAAMGLMQVCPETGSAYVKNKTLMFDPVTNIIAGCGYLSELHSKYVKAHIERENEYDASLCEYNSGRTINKNNANLTNYVYALKVKEKAIHYESLAKTSTIPSL